MDGQCTAQTATATTKIPFHGGKSKPSGDGLTTRTNLVDDKFWEITPSATDDDPAAFVTTWLVPAGDLSITIPTCPTTNTDCTNLSYSFPMTIPVPIDFVVVAHTSCRDCNAKVTSWNKHVVINAMTSDTGALVSGVPVSGVPVSGVHSILESHSNKIRWQIRSNDSTGLLYDPRHST